MASSHSWEVPRHSWEARGRDDDWPDEECSDPDEEVQTTPEGEFIEYMMWLLMTRTLNSRQFCTAMYWAGKAGMKGAQRYGFRPDTENTGHFARHLDPILGFKQFNKTLYDVWVPGHAKHDLSRTQHLIPVSLPHEVIPQDMDADVGYRTMLAEAIANKNLPPLYFEHPIVLAHPEELVAPIAIYIDFVPYSQTDSVVGIWLVNILTERRYIYAVYRKRNLCKCGCKGWCSFYVLFFVLTWSLRACARRRRPEQRHDQQPWRVTDEGRAAEGGKQLPIRVAVVYIKGDWSEYCSSLGLPNWRDALRPCFSCNGFGPDLFDPAGCSHDELRWLRNQPGDYEVACRRCELTRVVTPATFRKFVDKLKYDKSDKGARGRALARDCPELDLRAQDRLEPSMEIPDVGNVENHVPPFTVTMWRTTEETLTRHRNPLFAEDLGTLPATSLTVDALHCLYLGVMGVWCKLSVWALLLSGAYGERQGAADENLQNALLVMRHRRIAFYGQFDQLQPLEALPKVSDITPKMTGTHARPTCKTKGAETWGGGCSFCWTSASTSQGACGNAACV